MKKVSLNSLATKKDLKKVEKNVEGLDKRVGGLDKRVGGLDKRVGGLDKRVGGLDKKVGKLEREVKITKVEVRKFSTKLDGIRNKMWFDMENLKEEMKDEMVLLRNDVAEMKDEIVTEVKAMRTEFIAHKGTHDRQQETLEDHEKRINSLETPKLA